MFDEVGYMNDDNGIEPDNEPGCEDAVDDDSDHIHQKGRRTKENTRNLSKDGLKHHYVNLTEF